MNEQTSKLNLITGQEIWRIFSFFVSGLTGKIRQEIITLKLKKSKNAPVLIEVKMIWFNKEKEEITKRHFKVYFRHMYTHTIENLYENDEYENWYHYTFKEKPTHWIFEIPRTNICNGISYAKAWSNKNTKARGQDSFPTYCHWFIR